MTNVVEAKKTKFPSNNAAERAVLSGLIQFGQDGYIDASEILNSECFYQDENKWIYASIVEILTDSKKADLATLIATYTQLGYGDLINDKIRIDYVKSLFSFNVSKENFIKNAKIIRKLSIARDGMRVAIDAFNSLGEVDGSENVDDILSKIEKPIFDLTTRISSSSDDRTVKIGDYVLEYIQETAETKPDIMGIPSPWAIYNAAIGGGRRRGGVYLVGARPKTGKSSLAINDAVHVASLGIPVLYLDTEMAIKSQIPRLLAMMTHMPIKDIETGAFSDSDYDYNRVNKSGRELVNLPIHYRRVAGKPFNEILSIIRRWISQVVGTEGGVTKDCLVIYDYFKLMDKSSLDKLQEYQAMGFQIQDLVDFCNLHDITCSAFVQLNKEGISKDTSDIISQSDRLLWNCASVAFLKRKSQEEILEMGLENGNMKLIITEDQRFGPGLEENDWINLSFAKDMCLFKELGLRSQSRKKTDSGFDMVEGSEPEFTDEDFDRFDFGDDKYRKD